jgi:hypothetical protein
MENSMVREEYWDESEYNFFISLDDEDKLLYLYDLMIGDFKDEYYDTEFEDDILEATDVSDYISDDTSDYIFITSESEHTLEKVVIDMTMNGLILLNKTFTKKKTGEYILQCKLIGKVYPISIN